jgi:hypothetical protein
MAELMLGKDRFIRMTWAIKFSDEFGRDRETSVTSGIFHELEGELVFLPDKLESACGQ